MIATLIAAATGFPVMAPAQPTEWQRVQDWTISFYPTAGGCQAFAIFEDLTAFFIGYDTTGDVLALDVTIMDKRWAWIEDGGAYRVRLRFGDQSPWTLNMDALWLNGIPGMHILIDAASGDAEQFIAQFQREHEMQFQHGQTRLGRYPLDGSRKAFQQVRDCQSHYDKTVSRAPVPAGSLALNDAPEKDTRATQ
ncbi:hypothetical protein ACFMPD_09815 [Sedimentitalea sp. HM32M-2]|uniref:hypothetical protein n=1 Tax=Sedimentitalea sp. HM32M-2 TaxID=3351566 RepID=UPI00363BD843